MRVDTSFVKEKLTMTRGVIYIFLNAASTNKRDTHCFVIKRLLLTTERMISSMLPSF